MKNKADIPALAARLTTTVSPHEDPEERSTALAKFISGYDPDFIGPVLGAITADACSRIESGLTFLAMLDRQRLQKHAPEFDWGGLEHYFTKSKLDDTWRLFSRVEGEGVSYALAKISLLLEILFILIEDDLIDPETDMNCTGADVALSVLNQRDCALPEFTISLSSYPVGARKFMKEILSELDFIERTPGSWHFTISRSKLEVLSTGRNLVSHMGTGRMSQAVALRNAENLLKRLDLLVKALQMFPSGHPSIDPSADSFLSIISRFLTDGDQVTLSVMGDSVMVNDISVEARNSSIRSFIRSFTERKMSSLTFEKEVTPEDVKTFARIFNRPPAYIEEHGGMARLLEIRGLNSMSVNKFHYQLVSGDGDADKSMSRGEVTIEDAIFSELIDRLERGESIDPLPGSKIGDALKSVLAAARDNREEQRGMIARFVLALDPTILERGLLSDRAIQRGMAWKAVRKIIDRLLSSLRSQDPDLRHEALGKLSDMALLAVEKGKENSTLQILESIDFLLKRERDPDVLYRAALLAATVMEALLTRGMMSIALEAGKIIQNLQGTKYPRTELEAARRRALSETEKKLDTMEAADTLVIRILSEDESVSREAWRLALIAPPDNLVSRLIMVFKEDNRRIRSRAFQMLLRLGTRTLPSLHERLREIITAFDSNIDEYRESLPDIEWFMARNIIQVLREIASQESERILADLCRVPDPRVRRECLLALTKVSITTAESLSMHLVLDKSPGVAGMALDIITKQAAANPAFLPKIIEAFRSNTEIRHEIMESFSILGKHRKVVDFLCECLTEGSSSILFEGSDLISGAFRILRRYGGPEDVKILENLRDEVEGGFFKKGKLDRPLIQQLKETIESLSLSDSVIELEESSEEEEKLRKLRKAEKELKYSGTDDDITILGPDFQGRT